MVWPVCLRQVARAAAPSGRRPQQQRTVAAGQAGPLCSSRSSLVVQSKAKPAAQGSDKIPQPQPSPPNFLAPSVSLSDAAARRRAPACPVPAWRCSPARPPPRPGARHCCRRGCWRRGRWRRRSSATSSRRPRTQSSASPRLSSPTPRPTKSTSASYVIRSANLSSSLLFSLRDRCHRILLSSLSSVPES